MGKMKELFTNRCDELATTKYGKDFYELTREEQREVCLEAENALADYSAHLIDAERERRKYDNLE